MYISAALGDISPKKDEDKKWQYSYGWSFYFGGLSFILAEMVGVLAVNIYIEKNKELRCRSRTDIFKSTTHAMLRLPSYRYQGQEEEMDVLIEGLWACLPNLFYYTSCNISSVK